MYELSLQLMVYMSGHMLWGNMMEFFIPWAKNKYRLVRRFVPFAIIGLPWTKEEDILTDSWSNASCED